MGHMAFQIIRFRCAFLKKKKKKNCLNYMQSVLFCLHFFGDIVMWSHRGFFTHSLEQLCIAALLYLQVRM